MANRSAHTATWRIEDTLHQYGWPRVPYRFLAQLLTYIGDQDVQHYDATVALPHPEARAGRGAPDSTATIVVFTATHLFVQTVDCHRRAKRFASDVQVLRRSALVCMTSDDDVEVHLPPLRRLRDWLAGWSVWLASLVDALVSSWSWLRRWYDLEDPDGDVVVDLTYRDLRDSVLTLPLDGDVASADRLARFLPSLTADLI